MACRTEVKQLEALTDRGTIRSPEMLSKLAALIDVSDRVAQITRYDADVPCPEDVLFAVTEKTAQAYLAAHVALANGTVYRRQDLAQLPLVKLAELVGADQAAAVGDTTGLYVDPDRLVAATARAWSADLEMLEYLFKDAGIAVVTRQPALARPGASRASLEQLAAVLAD